MQQHPVAASPTHADAVAAHAHRDHFPRPQGDRLGEHDHDLTRKHEGEPQGQCIIVHGQVRDSDGRTVPHSPVETWQADPDGRFDPR